MIARKFVLTMLAGLVLALFPGCSRNDADIGARIRRESTSIINAAVTVAREAGGSATQSDRDKLIFKCILRRGNASEGDER